VYPQAERDAKRAALSPFSGNADADADAIYAHLSSHLDGVTQTEISNDVFKRNRHVKDIEAALLLLLSARKVRWEERQSTGNRPTTVWQIAS
jgi:hypothetical protein